MHIQIGFCLKFQFEPTILIFGPNLPKKGMPDLKPINFAYAYWFRYQISAETGYWFFGPNLLKKGISSRIQRKWTPQFQLKLTVLNFWTKFAEKGIFGLKQKNRIFWCVHGRYSLYLTFPHGGRRTQRH